MAKDGAAEFKFLKLGTRIEIHGCPAIGGYPEVPPQIATIARWTAASGPRDEMPGWHIVRRPDGHLSCVHESRFRVVGNR